MYHFNHIADLKKYVQEQNLKGKSIGLVPTMGALHDGHASLVRASLKENDVTITSIFINPVQFNNKEDFQSYPKTETADFNFLKSLGNTAVFSPLETEMYPDSPKMALDFGSLQVGMEGKFREGHFNGVGIVVGKLLNIVKPDRAYFGQKDLQQFAIISQLVRDLSFDVELKCVPILRSEDGLALSSRNQRLTAEQLKDALIFYKSLAMAKSMLKDDTPLALVTERVSAAFSASNVNLEYFEIVDPTTLEQIDQYNAETNIALCIAGYVGNVRLIDNIIIGNEY